MKSKRKCTFDVPFHVVIWLVLEHLQIFVPQRQVSNGDIFCQCLNKNTVFQPKGTKKPEEGENSRVQKPAISYHVMERD